MDKLKQALADLNFCSEVIDRERFAGFDQNPKGVRDLLYSAIKSAEREAAELSQFKTWYEEAQLAANENGFGPGSAADAIRHFAAEAFIAPELLDLLKRVHEADDSHIDTSTSWWEARAEVLRKAAGRSTE